LRDAHPGGRIVLFFLMYVPCVLYSLVSRPTNVQHMYFVIGYNDHNCKHFNPLIFTEFVTLMIFVTFSSVEG